MTRVSGVGGVLAQGSFDSFVNKAQQALTTADRVVTQAQKAVAAGNPLRAVLSSVEIRSTLMPPLVLTADDLLAEWRAPPDPNAFTRFMKPTVVVKSPLLRQEKVFAPFGVAGPKDWEPMHNKVWLGVFGGIVGLFALGVYAGYRTGKKAR